jgi:hypothetical protein
MATEEIALQFINERALVRLHGFLSSPSPKTLDLLIHTPALYKVAEREFKIDSTLHGATLEVIRWLYTRVFVVLHQLKKHGLPSESVRTTPPQAEEWHWQKVLFPY